MMLTRYKYVDKAILKYRAHPSIIKIKTHKMELMEN